LTLARTYCRLYLLRSSQQLKVTFKVIPNPFNKLFIDQVCRECLKKPANVTFILDRSFQVSAKNEPKDSNTKINVV